MADLLRVKQSGIGETNNLPGLLNQPLSKFPLYLVRKSRSIAPRIHDLKRTRRFGIGLSFTYRDESVPGKTLY